MDLNVVLVGQAVRRHAVLERRRRPTRITVEPLADGRTQASVESAELTGDPADPRWDGGELPGGPDDDPGDGVQGPGGLETS